MKVKRKKFIVITLLIIGIILMILPLTDNVKSISDIFKKQVLINSVIEFIITTIGISIIIGLFMLIFYTKIKQDKLKELTKSE